MVKATSGRKSLFWFMISEEESIVRRKTGTSCFKGTEFMTRKSMQQVFEADGHIVFTALSVLRSLRPNSGNDALFV